MNYIRLPLLLVVSVVFAWLLMGSFSLQDDILDWLRRLAIILVTVLGGMAMEERISWKWCVGATFMIVLAFQAPHIVAWTRGMLGVFLNSMGTEITEV